MARKDHLITIQEDSRLNKKFSIRNNVIAFQATQPTIAQQINGVGATSKTPDEVKDTKFPVLNPIDEIGKNLSAALDIDLSLENSPFHCLELSDVGDTITDLAIDFINLVKNKAERFILDITKDPGNVSTPTITFDPPVANLPAGFPATDPRYLLEIVARETPSETRFEVVNRLSTGVSFPIVYPVIDHGSPGATLTIDLDLTTAHVHLVTLTANLTITFNETITALEAIPFHIEFEQNATGNFTVTYTNTMNVEPVITLTPLAKTLAVFETVDGGSTYYGLNTGGNSIVKDNLGDHTATQNLDLATFGIINIGDLEQKKTGSIRVFAQKRLEVLADDTTIGMIDWKAFDASVAEEFYGRIEVVMETDVSANNEEGSMKLKVMSDGVPNVDYIVLNDAGTNEIDILQPMDMTGKNITDIGSATADLFQIINAGAGANPLISSNSVNKDAELQGNWIPDTDDTFDLGTTLLQWRDLHLDGIANIDVLNMGFGDTAQHTFFGFMTIADRTTPADPVSAASVNLFLDSATGELSVRKFGSTTVSLEGAGGSSFADNVFDVHDDITPTKEITFQLVNATGTNIFDIFGTTDTYTFPDGGGEVIMSQGTQTINGTKTFGNNVNLNGSITTIGNATTDKVVFTAELASNIIPDGDGTRLIGQITDRFSIITSQVFRLPTTTGDSTTRLLSDTDGIEYRALSGDAHEFFIDTTRVLSIAGSGTLLLADVAHTIVSNPGVSMVLDVDAGELIALAVDGTVGLTIKDITGDPLPIVKTYTDASRPSASTAGAGAFIFNSDDGGLNVSDGSNWRAPSGGWVNT